MKHVYSLFTVFLFLITSSVIFAPAGYAQTWSWGRAGLVTGCEGWAIATDPFGNVFNAGMAMPLSTGTIRFDTVAVDVSDWNAVWVKYDRDGHALWAGTPIGCIAQLTNISADAAGNLIVYGFYDYAYMHIGSVILTGSYPSQYFIAKINPSGTVLWAVNGGNNIEYYYDIDSIPESPRVLMNGGVTTDHDGNIYVTGTFADSTFHVDTLSFACSGGDDIFVAKYSPDGNLIWANTIGGAGNDYSSGITVGQNGNVYITGLTKSPLLHVGGSVLSDPYSGIPRALIAEFSSSGTPLWAQESGGARGAYGIAITSDEAGNIYMTGGFDDTSITFGRSTLTRYNPGNAPHLAAYVVQYSPANTVTWGRTICASDTCAWTSGITLAACNQVWVSGGYNNSLLLDSATVLPGYPGYNRDPSFIAGFDLSGAIAGHATLSSGGDDVNGIASDRNGNILLGGDYLDTVVIGMDTFNVVFSRFNTEYLFCAKYNNVISPSDTTYSETDTTICSSGADSITLAAPSGYDHYLWNDGSISQNHVFHSAGTYWVCCMSCGGGALIDTIHLGQGGLDTSETTSGVSVCVHSDSEPVALTAPTGGTGYNWFDGDTSAVDSVVSDGVFWVGYSNGCNYYVDSFRVTRVQQPLPVVGPDSVCRGEHITLSESVGGGSWISSDTGVAQINPLAGTLTGVAAGVAVITYDVSNVCMVVTTVNVLAAPCTNEVSTLVNISGNIELFPVPVSQELEVSIDFATFQSFTITDVVGQVLAKGDITSQQFSVDVSKFPNGIYYLTFHGMAGNLVKKFVKA